MKLALRSSMKGSNKSPIRNKFKSPNKTISEVNMSMSGLLRSSNFNKNKFDRTVKSLSKSLRRESHKDFGKSNKSIGKGFRFRSRSEYNKFLENKNRYVIPNAYKDRIEFIKRLFDNDSLMRHYNNYPSKQNTTIEEMAKYLASFSKVEIEVISIIFLWVCNSISFDAVSYFAGSPVDNSPEYVYKNSSGTSEGFANLFQLMCSKIGYKAEKFHGYLKQNSFIIGQDCSKSNHYWNAVLYSGKWYLIDPTLGAGVFTDDNKYERKFNVYYFLTPSEYLIDTHRPELNRWQLSHKSINLKTFENTPIKYYKKFYTSVFDNNIILYTYGSPDIYLKDNMMQMKIGIKNMVLQVKFMKDNSELTSLAKSAYDEVNCIYTIDLMFDSGGEYILDLIGKPINASEFIYTSVLTFKINVNTTKKLDKYQTGTKKCYDNAGAHLYEPKSYYLKKGSDVKFKVKVKNATNVVVLDHKQWNYLKRKSEDIWEGSVVIQNEDITICAQKGLLVFTEVFEFKGINK